MSEQRRHLERALHGCAERGAPADTVDLWPAIRERVNGQQMSEEQTSGEHAGGGLRRPSRTVSNTPFALALAALSVLILGAVVYVAAGAVNEASQHGPPTGKEHGFGKEADQGQGVTYRLFRGAVPGGAKVEEMGLTKSADGAKVTLQWAYADEEFVVVGIEARDLSLKRWTEGPQGTDPVVLQPVLIGEEGENEAKLPPRVDLTDGSGENFTEVDGMTQYPGAVAVFEAPKDLKSGREHRFRLEVPLQEHGMPGMPGEKPAAGPFVFNFEIPVHPVPVVEVGQEVEAKGITLTLERVVNSPSRPQAIVCVDAPDGQHLWTPWLERNGLPVDAATAPRRLEDGCWSLTMGDPVEGRSSVTVAYIHGIPRSASDPDEDGKEIRGPWTFEFEAPDG